MSPKALDMLCKYSWPGNVRELENLLERLVIMVEKNVIDLPDLPSPFGPEGLTKKEPAESKLFDSNSLKQAKKVFEKEFIKRKLIQNNNNISQTAKALGVHRSFLHRKLKQFN